MAIDFHLLDGFLKPLNFNLQIWMPRVDDDYYQYDRVRIESCS
jgi:hypothetical protein